MSRSILPTLLSLAVALVAAAPASALQPPSAGAVSATPNSTHANFAMLRGRGFGRPTYRPRAARPYPRSSYRRTRGFGHFGGSLLRALGIAYLVHALFGWGAGGGSPFGLLIVVAIIAYLIGRRRSRRRDYYGYAH
jgi:predicted lipid-binding transport protein (Tim44 family)